MDSRCNFVLRGDLDEFVGGDPTNSDRSCFAESMAILSSSDSSRTHAVREESFRHSRVSKCKYVVRDIVSGRDFESVLEYLFDLIDDCCRKDDRYRTIFRNDVLSTGVEVVASIGVINVFGPVKKDAGIGELERLGCSFEYTDVVPEHLTNLGVVGYIKVTKDKTSKSYPLFKDHKQLIATARSQADEIRSKVSSIYPNWEVGKMSLRSKHCLSVSKCFTCFGFVPRYRYAKGVAYVINKGINCFGIPSEASESKCSTVAEFCFALLRSFSISHEYGQLANESFVYNSSPINWYEEGPFDKGLDLATHIHLMHQSLKEIELRSGDDNALATEHNIQRRKAMLLLACFCQCAGWFIDDSVVASGDLNVRSLSRVCSMFVNDVSKRVIPLKLFEFFVSIESDEKSYGWYENEKVDPISKYAVQRDRLLDALIKKGARNPEKLARSAEELCHLDRSTITPHFYLKSCKAGTVSPMIYHLGQVLANCCFVSGVDNLDTLFFNYAKRYCKYGEKSLKSFAGEGEELMAFCVAYFPIAYRVEKDGSKSKFKQVRRCEVSDELLCATALLPLLEKIGKTDTLSDLDDIWEDVLGAYPDWSDILTEIRAIYETMSNEFKDSNFEPHYRMSKYISFMARNPLGGYPRAPKSQIVATAVCHKKYVDTDTSVTQSHLVEKMKSVIKAVLRSRTHEDLSPRASFARQIREINKSKSSAGFVKVFAEDGTLRNHTQNTKDSGLGYFPAGAIFGYMDNSEPDDLELSICAELFYLTSIEGSICHPTATGARDDRGRYKARGVFPSGVGVLGAELGIGLKEGLKDFSKLNVYPATNTRFIVTSSSHKTEVMVTQLLAEQIYADNPVVEDESSFREKLVNTQMFISTDFSSFDATASFTMEASALAVEELIDEEYWSGSHFRTLVFFKLYASVAKTAGVFGSFLNVSSSGKTSTFAFKALLSGMMNTSTLGGLANAVMNHEVDKMMLSSAYLESVLPSSSVPFNTQTVGTKGLDFSKKNEHLLEFRPILSELCVQGDDGLKRMTMMRGSKPMNKNVKNRAAAFLLYRYYFWRTSRCFAVLGAFMSLDSFFASKNFCHFLSHYMLSRRGRGGIGKEKEINADGEDRKLSTFPSLMNGMMNLYGYDLGAIYGSVLAGLSLTFRYADITRRNSDNSFYHFESDLPDPFLGLFHIIKTRSVYVNPANRSSIWRTSIEYEDYKAPRANLSRVRVLGKNMDLTNYSSDISKINKFLSTDSYNAAQAASSLTKSLLGDEIITRVNGLRTREVVGKAMDQTAAGRRSLRKEQVMLTSYPRLFGGRSFVVSGKTLTFWMDRSFSRCPHIEFIPDPRGFMGKGVMFVNGAESSSQPFYYPKYTTHWFLTSVFGLTEDAAVPPNLSVGSGLFASNIDVVYKLRNNREALEAMGVSEPKSVIEARKNVSDIMKGIFKMASFTGVTSGEVSLSSRVFMSSSMQLVQTMPISVADQSEARNLKQVLAEGIAGMWLAAAGSSIHLMLLSGMSPRDVLDVERIVLPIIDIS